jgi:hypothetical protein
MTLSKTTQDHDEIQEWAERRGAIPSEVASTERKGEPGILRFQFPKAKNANDSKLKEISWEEFFEKFDDNGLALVYQDVTAEGAESNFNKLIHPESDKGTGKSSSRSKKSTGTKSSETKRSTSGQRKTATKSATKSKRRAA